MKQKQFDNMIRKQFHHTCRTSPDMKEVLSRMYLHCAEQSLDKRRLFMRLENTQYLTEYDAKPLMDTALAIKLMYDAQAVFYKQQYTRITNVNI